MPTTRHEGYTAGVHRPRAPTRRSGDTTWLGVLVAWLAMSATGCSLLMDFDSPIVDCDDPVDCSAPSAVDRASVCGTVYDLGATETVMGADGRMTVSLKDSANLPVATAPVNTCGFFRLLDFVVPNPLVTRLFVDDTSIDDDLHATTAMDVLVQGGAVNDGVLAFTVRNTLEQNWSNQAPELTGGFAQLGALLSIFVSTSLAMEPVPPFSGSPATGITPSLSVPGALATYCFSDLDPLVRTEISPMQPSSGASGSCLTIGGSQSDPVGGLDATGCPFPGAPVLNQASVLQVAIANAPCP